MKWKYIFLWIILGIGVCGCFSSVVSYLGEQIGRERGFKEGFEAGFRKGEYHGAVVGPGKFADLLRAKDEALKKATDKPKPIFTEFWEYIKFTGENKEEKYFFYSPFASPPLIQEFEGAGEEVFHYIYCNDGVYAFPAESWKFLEIYIIIQGRDVPPKKPRFYGGAEVHRTF